MILVLVGTRPELIKVAPILRKLQRENVSHIFVHSDQHYSYNMDKKIMKDLGLRLPDYNLNVGSNSHAIQTAKIMEGIEKICLKHNPSFILVHGDTNTTLAGALSAKKLHIKVGHIEAGLRSFDYRMPEEINRILVDRISDYLFTPTEIGRQNLINEGIDQNKIIVTGNTIVDALYDHIVFSLKSRILKKNKINPNSYILVTLHRAENVDTKERLENFIKLLEHATKKLNRRIIFPIHPRTRHKIEEFNIKLSQNITLIHPVGYIDMLALMNNAFLIMTDSGGVQEEAYILKKPLVTLRDSTERPETLSANFIIDNNKKSFNEAMKVYDAKKVSWSDSFGDGTASQVIVDKILEMEMDNKVVSVLGMGYIGFPTALLIANAGITVNGYDIDKNKINLLKNGKLFFEETGLKELFKSVLKKKNFYPTKKLFASDVYIIAVPTPQKKGSAELKYVLSALKEIERVFQPGGLIIVESTIGPRDCVDILIPEIKKWNKEFYFSHCPERAIPGNTLYEMVHNDRIIGGMDKKSNVLSAQLYSQFVQGNIFKTDPTTAAACKVMENTYRATNIALANEFAKIASELDFNVWEAIELSNKHPRVNIHSPGPGVGGHCIPIDPWFFINQKNESGVIETSLLINEKMAEVIFREISYLSKKHEMKSPKIGLLGYAYKKNVDDSRETPTQKLFDLLSKKFEVVINDPYITNETFNGLKDVLSTCTILVLSTDHDLYKKINFKKYPNIEFIYDTRNLFNLSSIKGTEIRLYKLGVKNR